jgi:hypothetical protein
MGLAAVGAHKLGGLIPLAAIFRASHRIGQARVRRIAPSAISVEEQLRVL